MSALPVGVKRGFTSAEIVAERQWRAPESDGKTRYFSSSVSYRLKPPAKVSDRIHEAGCDDKKGILRAKGQRALRSSAAFLAETEPAKSRDIPTNFVYCILLPSTRKIQRNETHALERKAVLVPSHLLWRRLRIVLAFVWPELSSVFCGTIPAGFDCLVQFSSFLLSRALDYNLGQLGLNPLNARVPYQPQLISPGLLAAIQPHIRAIDYTQGGIFLEAQLLRPVIESLRSTGSIVTNSTGVLARSKGAQGSALQTQRTVDLSWTLQINLFTATINATTLAASSTTIARTAAPGLGGIRTSVGGISTGPGAGGSPPPGDRVTLAQGTALMHVPTQLVVFSNALEFWLAANFDGVQPAA